MAGSINQRFKSADAATASSLTDSSGGTAASTIVAISGSGDDTDINANFASLTTELNALITDVASLRAAQND